MGSFANTARRSQTLHHTNLALIPDKLPPLALPRSLPVLLVVREATTNDARKSLLADSMGSIGMVEKRGNAVGVLKDARSGNDDALDTGRKSWLRTTSVRRGSAESSEAMSGWLHNDYDPDPDPDWDPNPPRIKANQPVTNTVRSQGIEGALINPRSGNNPLLHAGHQSSVGTVRERELAEAHLDVDVVNNDIWVPAGVDVDVVGVHSLRRDTTASRALPRVPHPNTESLLDTTPSSLPETIKKRGNTGPPEEGTHRDLLEKLDIIIDDISDASVRNR
jgi:hypothetical protein